MKKLLFIGVMSGTSMDGVDVALCEINASSCRLIQAKEYPFPKKLKNKLLASISASLTLQEFGKMNQQLGILYADTIQDFLHTFKLDPQTITAIGLHGQTLWHEPNSTPPFSLQLGDASIVYAQTDIKVVHDFRSADLANGGQGAPLTPAFHNFVFAQPDKKVAIVNIGGMANITILGEPIQGWDSGCGNVLLDYWVEKQRQQPYDADGAYAKSGTLHQALLSSFLTDNYFTKQAPKTTGREYFNATWLQHHLTQFPHLAAKDIQRTLLELSAQTIAKDLQDKNISQAILCGGGAKNSFLMQRLQELCSIPMQSSDSLGVDGDMLEAMAFAWFAYKRVHNEPIALQSVTGAKKNSLLGTMYG